MRRNARRGPRESSRLDALWKLKSDLRIGSSLHNVTAVSRYPRQSDDEPPRAARQRLEIGEAPVRELLANRTHARKADSLKSSEVHVGHGHPASVAVSQSVKCLQKMRSHSRFRNHDPSPFDAFDRASAADRDRRGGVPDGGLATGVASRESQHVSN